MNKLLIGAFILGILFGGWGLVTALRCHHAGGTPVEGFSINGIVCIQKYEN